MNMSVEKQNIARLRTGESNRGTLEPIAIIGIGCRFPGGADNPQAFYASLCNGVDATSEIPPDRWSIHRYYDPNPEKPGKSRTCRGGFLKQIDQFDAQFFGISPREAVSLDPQQRLLLEVAWEAMEDAGLVPGDLAGANTGVYMGAFSLDYHSLQLHPAARNQLEAHTATGVVMTMMANRISYAFDFRGPSMAIDTACSSSLVAVHLACTSLRSGECTLALAGGVNIMIGPDFTITESKGGFLSPDGHCKSFDASANGYVRGEGAGVVVLKPLSRALADGDPIYALIRGSAVNQDGHTNGITVPSRASQEALLWKVYQDAGVSPGDVRYVEAHGTGTPVGDPIEAYALGTVLATNRPPSRACVMGSVKTNIGHLEAAAGVAGLIKAVLCLKYRQIPAHLHFRQPNPAIPFDELSLRIPTVLESWPAGTGPALAAVNSFGFGGTNAHVILEEAPRSATSQQDEEKASSGRAYLLPLSARNSEALLALAESYSAFLKEEDIKKDIGASIEALCYSASMRRSHHEYRLSLVGHSLEEFAQGLEAFQNGEAYPGLTANRAAPDQRPLAFVFSGMGPQWWAMGRELLQQEPVFREVIERCDAAFFPYTGWSLLQEMLADEASSRMAETAVAQLANFALQVALVALWRTWGIEPSAVVGHSTGEVAAAYVAGALTWGDAVRVVFHRSRLQQQTTGQGQMMAVELPLEDAWRLLEGNEERISIAAINSPTAVTLVGDSQALEEVKQHLDQQEVFCRYLRGQVPYHSHYMNPLREELLDVLDGLAPRVPELALYSTVTGKLVNSSLHDANYWWHNVRDTVLFAEATDQLIQDGYTTFLEIAPHPVLTSSVSECLAKRGREGMVIPSLRRAEEDRAMLLGSLGALYSSGKHVNWATVSAGSNQFIHLPTYPWQRQRYWAESEESRQERVGQPDHPLLGFRMAAPRPTWKLDLNTNILPYLNDHQIQGVMVLPGAAYVEMALAAATQVFGKGVYALENIEFHKALFLSHSEPLLYMTLDPQDGTFEVYSEEKEMKQAWTLHAKIKLFQA